MTACSNASREAWSSAFTWASITRCLLRRSPSAKTERLTPTIPAKAQPARSVASRMTEAPTGSSQSVPTTTMLSKVDNKPGPSPPRQALRRIARKNGANGKRTPIIGVSAQRISAAVAVKATAIK